MPFLLILAVGHDPAILSTRSSILRSSGYIVKESSSVAEAINLFEYLDFDLVLLCHTIPLRERDELTLAVRSSGSRIPIYTVAPVSFSRGFTPGLAGGTFSSDPEKLKKEIEDVLRVVAARDAEAKWNTVAEPHKLNS